MIGKEGQKLKNIELATATKISIPRHDDPSDVIKIVGTKEGLDKARHQIQIISDEQVCRDACIHVYVHFAKDFQNFTNCHDADSCGDNWC